jgi:hypothetical protein
LEIKGAAYLLFGIAATDSLYPALTSAVLDIPEGLVVYCKLFPAADLTDAVEIIVLIATDVRLLGLIY